MSPLFKLNNALLKFNNALAVSSGCCCDEAVVSSWIPDIIGINQILPETPSGQCFPSSANITITSDNNSAGFPMNVTITLDEGLC